MQATIHNEFMYLVQKMLLRKNNKQQQNYKALFLVDKKGELITIT
jgi:hypothetical protein